MISTAISEALWGAGFSLLDSQRHKRNNFVKLPLPIAVLASVGLNTCSPLCGSYPKYTARCCQGRGAVPPHSSTGTRKVCSPAWHSPQPASPQPHVRGGGKIALCPSPPLRQLQQEPAGRAQAAGGTCPWWCGRNGKHCCFSQGANVKTVPPPISHPSVYSEASTRSFPAFPPSDF